jgi:hypothetical protein
MFNRQEDIIAEFFEQIDMAGPFMPFNSLQEQIVNAPMEVKASLEFQYVLGLCAGRKIYEQPEDAPDDAVEETSFEVLEEMVLVATDEIRETEKFQYVLGLYDGRMIHECLGGIKNAD